MISKYRGISIESTLSGWFIVRTLPNDTDHIGGFTQKFDTWEGVTAYIDQFID